MAKAEKVWERTLSINGASLNIHILRVDIPEGVDPEKFIPYISTMEFRDFLGKGSLDRIININMMAASRIIHLLQMIQKETARERLREMVRDKEGHCRPGAMIEPGRNLRVDITHEGEVFKVFFEDSKAEEMVYLGDIPFKSIPEISEILRELIGKFKDLGEKWRFWKER